MIKLNLLKPKFSGKANFIVVNIYRGQSSTLKILTQIFNQINLNKTSWWKTSD